MNHNQTDRSAHQLWAEFRFGVIGGLLSSPSETGELMPRLRQLALQEWQHPITGKKVFFSVPTIERWYYEAKSKTLDPVGALRRKLRSDCGSTRHMSEAIKNWLDHNYRQHSSWSWQLHRDNLEAWLEKHPENGMTPSYSSVRRYMKTRGWFKTPRPRSPRSPAAHKALDRRIAYEVRSYEAQYVGGLWHLDFHHGSRQVVTPRGDQVTPLCLCILDDHSRLVCHIQWYLFENTQALVHGFSQAILKRSLPRALMSDNGSAMISGEFTQGLMRLGIEQETTLEHSPYQNGKQETLWSSLEGRLMAMLEGKKILTLEELNLATQAWIELEYHAKVHSEIGTTPMDRFLHAKDVLRPAPDPSVIKLAFRQDVKRSQRRSDGTFSLASKRFEIPAAWRTLPKVTVRYARWDLAEVHLVDDRTQSLLCRVHPLDKAFNSNGFRRKTGSVDPIPPSADQNVTKDLPPLLEKLIADYAEKGLPPAYLAFDNDSQSTESGDLK